MRTSSEHAIQPNRTKVRRRGETERTAADRAKPLLQMSPASGRDTTPGAATRGNPPCWCEGVSIAVITKVRFSSLLP